MNIKQDKYEEYYTLWKSGATPKEIRESMGLSHRRYRNMEPYFLEYCQQEIKRDKYKATPEQPADPRKHIKLTPKRVTQFLEYVAAGLPYDKIALLMDVPLTTVFNVWFLDKKFKTIVDNATLVANTRVIASLYQRAVGYEYFEDHEEEVEEPLRNAEGLPVLDDFGKQKIGIVQTKKKKVKKRRPPDVKAQMFWLINRDPNNWTMEGVQSESRNRGLILKYLQELGEKEQSPKYEEFDKLQQAHDDRYHK